jgi:hypothetical protein
MSAGLLAAFAGLEHGIGELTSGDVASDSLVIESWPHVAAFDVLDGEPAMTLIPDLRVAGAVTVLVSLVIVAVGLIVRADPSAGRPGIVRTGLARCWPSLLILSVTAYLALFPGVVLLSWAGVDALWATVVLPIVAFGALVLSLVAASASDCLAAGARAAGDEGLPHRLD